MTNEEIIRKIEALRTSNPDKTDLVMAIKRDEELKKAIEYMTPELFGELVRACGSDLSEVVEVVSELWREVESREGEGHSEVK
ncbi:MAG: hypothetical protein WA057_03175, partial [Candidatus Magasanikiibacteriota bacterium]